MFCSVIVENSDDTETDARTLTLVDVHVEIVARAFQTRLKTFAEPPGDRTGAVGRTDGRLLVLRVRQIVHDRQHNWV